MNTAGQEDARQRRPRPVIADGKETFFLTAGRRACIGRHRPTTFPPPPSSSRTKAPRMSRHDTQSLCQCRLLLLLSACSHYVHIVIRHVTHNGMAPPALL